MTTYSLIVERTLHGVVGNGVNIGGSVDAVEDLQQGPSEPEEIGEGVETEVDKMPGQFDDLRKGGDHDGAYKEQVIEKRGAQHHHECKRHNNMKGARNTKRLH